MDMAANIVEVGAATCAAIRFLGGKAKAGWDGERQGSSAGWDGERQGLFLENLWALTACPSY